MAREIGPGSVRVILRSMIVVALAAGVVLSVPVLAYYYFGIPTVNFLRDPNAISGTPFYTGLVSNLGILLWTAAAVVCLFTYALLPKASRGQKAGRFLLFSGQFTILLLSDDLLQLHEVIAPRHLGLDEKVVLGIYGLLIAAYLTYFRDLILREYAPFAMACGLLGLSIVVDQLSLPVHVGALLEDGFKFAGIAAWLAYFVHVSSRFLHAEIPADLRSEPRKS